MRDHTGMKILWAELLPYEFKQRLAECPVVYLPLGLCEPHGQISASGLDTMKADEVSADSQWKPYERYRKS
ncbi:MAG: hypothetical protein A2189_02530 [Paenibacillus sp. RIFOXYA1_FULL_44_5]|nr:MAG: hypothetical protein A2189_02530 [Paenibacillus sp. RIFOXYA1_FULL_44_5]